MHLITSLHTTDSIWGSITGEEIFPEEPEQGTDPRMAELLIWTFAAVLETDLNFLFAYHSG